jgi:hypothetical protein
MLCIDYYEARQRKNRANSWNDCHSQVEVPRQQAQKKICLDFVHARFNASVWLQAGQYLALAAQIPAKPKTAVRAYQQQRNSRPTSSGDIRRGWFVRGCSSPQTSTLRSPTKPKAEAS